MSTFEGRFTSRSSKVIGTVWRGAQCAWRRSATFPIRLQDAGFRDADVAAHLAQFRIAASSLIPRIGPCCTVIGDSYRVAYASVAKVANSISSSFRTLCLSRAKTIFVARIVRGFGDLSISWVSELP